MGRKGPSSDPKHRGVVVFVKHDGDMTFGFIRPIDVPPATSDAASRALNCWFGNSSLQGQEICKGDLVDYVLFRTQKPGAPTKGAYRVWIRKPADNREIIETLPGIDDL